MSFEKSTKDNIMQQLNFLSKSYEELLKHIDEMESPTEQQVAKSHSWTIFFKKDIKKRANNT